MSSITFAVVPSPYSLGHNLLVTHIFSRETPLSTIACPTPVSLKYPCAVSRWRYPDYSAATTASCEVSFKSFRPLSLLSCSNRWIWVPRPSCGTCTPLLRVIRGTSATEEMLDMLDVPELGISGVLVSVSWFFCKSSLCPESVWDIADVF